MFWLVETQSDTSNMIPIQREDRVNKPNPQPLALLLPALLFYMFTYNYWYFLIIRFLSRQHALKLSYDDYQYWYFLNVRFLSLQHTIESIGMCCYLLIQPSFLKSLWENELVSWENESVEP